MQNEDNQIIFLKNDEGQEQQFELICTLDLEEREYVILADPDSDDAIAMRIEGEGETAELIPVDDDEEFAEVAAAYDAISPEELGYTE
ncbi:DUF1292 domain-containing protein [Pseudoramibacter sp.]|jgi:uncharacterized protein YrzB (UPF0473 family)|uniref:DUF1292 domain-containing protein n=1 Tax=Pseudoramibacter sp. TaxID=2034862 RepID=UPI0025DA5E4F|nr:DUF1292 domain-containing protein [Pseudoramibacter sp.]MCH4072753.1 DUF1292 domain-containing protein [Pseudoramibacter sp.]MCH4106524.1 DUF1292 domain-containing protein [Pseudoramibacter sp.]